MRNIIFFATLAEAGPTIEMLQARLELKDPNCFHFGQGFIICTGIGLKNAYKAALNAPKEQVRWINAGVAGCLNGTGLIGQVFDIDLVGLLRFESRSKKCAPRGKRFSLSDLNNGLDKAALFSSKAPIYYHIASGFSNACVDMEGYAITFVAKRHGIPMQILKVISDTCSEKSSATIAINLPKLSTQLAQSLLDILCRVG